MLWINFIVVWMPIVPYHFALSLGRRIALVSGRSARDVEDALFSRAVPHSHGLPPTRLPASIPKRILNFGIALF